MCAPARGMAWNGSAPHAAVQQDVPSPDAETPLTPACSEQTRPENRVLLMTVVDAFHGSTALEAVFISSPHVATLCANKVWQCEARKYYEQVKKEDYFTAKDLLITSSEFWNLSKPILLDKGPRDFNKTRWELTELEREKEAMLPQPMLSRGIKNLHFVYVFMWRPVCLAKLSSHARLAIGRNAQAFATEELGRLELMVQAHKYLNTRGLLTLVLSLADLLWDPARAQRRLSEFLPCMGTTDLSFKPKLGRDIFPGNKWKAEASVKEFSDSINPWDCCGYAIREKTCQGDTNFFKVLAPDLQSRANTALTYLLALS